MSESDSFEDYGEFDDLLESIPPEFDEHDVDYPLKVLSHHARGTSAHFPSPKPILSYSSGY